MPRTASLAPRPVTTDEPVDERTTPVRGSRLRRVLVAMVVLAVAAVSLAACQQPLPDITVQSGAFSTTVRPSTYCFDLNQCRQNALLDLPVVRIKPGATVLVDVPRAVSTSWQVRAVGLTRSSRIGTSGPIRSSHTYRIAANLNGNSPYVVAVDKLINGRPDGSRWSFLVQTASDSA